MTCGKTPSPQNQCGPSLVRKVPRHAPFVQHFSEKEARIPNTRRIEQELCDTCNNIVAYDAFMRKPSMGSLLLTKIDINGDKPTNRSLTEYIGRSQGLLQDPQPSCEIDFDNRQKSVQQEEDEARHKELLSERQPGSRRVCVVTCPEGRLNPGCRRPPTH